MKTANQSWVRGVGPGSGRALGGLAAVAVASLFVACSSETGAPTASEPSGEVTATLSAAGGSVLYRVNAGGAQLAATDGGLAWAADTTAAPSAYCLGCTNVFATTAAITGGPSVPAGIPLAAFQTERWDAAGGATLRWSFPVTPGKLVQVRLYFAETYINAGNAAAVGPRVFDVAVDGAVPAAFKSVNVYAEAGANVGIMKSFDISSDGSVDLEFLNGTQNPAIKAIELVELKPTLYRVNVGGPAVAATDGGLPWSADTAATPSAYCSNCGNIYAVTTPVTLGPTVPSYVPASVLQDERWDPAGGADQAWAFPVPAGTGVEVRLFFAETFLTAANNTTAGPRIFDVSLDGAAVPPFTGINVFAQAGNGVGVMRSYKTISDGSVDLVLKHVSENPMLKAIEIVQTPTVFHRINAGGPTLAAADGSQPSWAADSQASPNPLSNMGCTGCSQAFSTAAAINMPDTVPAAVPVALFQTERWDAAGTPEMTWALPVPAGTPIEVRLYFAEIYGGIAAIGQRAFNVSVDGSVPAVFADIDVYATARTNAALVKKFKTVSDGVVDLVFQHVAENPAIKGIEVVLAPVSGAPDTGPAQPVFGANTLTGTGLTSPTVLGFGPDKRLYVAQQNGLIKAYSVSRTGPGAYAITATELITLIQSIPNHNDDGTTTGVPTTRQLTGLVTAGTATAPILYVTSSDSRIGAGGGGTDSNLDTNSGIISKLTKTATGWDHVELVRGLPRSEENHATNGVVIDRVANVLYVAQGGNTNAGAPSHNFALTNEYALSGALLSINLTQLEALPTQTDAAGKQFKYDLPTLDDPARANANGVTNPTTAGYDGVDVGDPFGGRDGMNQAKLVPGGPVQIQGGGFRNPYDLVLTKAGKLYITDNGANSGWGGHVTGEATYPGVGAGTCSNDYIAGEPGSTGPGPHDDVVNNRDQLHYVRTLVAGDKNYPGRAERYYGGHPIPVRGNPAGAGLYQNDTFLPPGSPLLPVDWPPVPVALANPAECDFRNPGVSDNSIAVFNGSTNGIAEYTASNFGGVMQGALLLASFTDNIYKLIPNAAGDAITNCPAPPATCGAVFASGFGSTPLDLIAQGDADVFPGTVWAVTYGSNGVTVFEPADYSEGSGCVTTDPNADADSDGYTNQDEALNGTNPCSATSTPPDADGDHLSDLADADDDNDGLLDSQDAFALDAKNGTLTALPVNYELASSAPGTGLFGVGFTGLMSNGVSDYQSLYTPANVTAGTGTLRVAAVAGGEARGAVNSGQNGFQFGVASSSALGVFTVAAQVNAPFFGGVAPVARQQQGVFIGTGDQSNYVSVALSADAAGAGVLVTLENGDAFSEAFTSAPAALASPSVTLLLEVDPVAGAVRTAYQLPGASPVLLGPALTLSGNLLAAVRGTYAIGTKPSALAVGLLSSAAVGASSAPFAATWESVKVAVGSLPAAPVIPTYTADVQPLLAPQCGACHGGAGLGGHNIASVYSDVFKLAVRPQCTGKNIGQCAIILIKLGIMPQGTTCGTDPTGPTCYTPAQIATIQAWVDGGEPL